MAFCILFGNHVLLSVPIDFSQVNLVSSHSQESSSKVSEYPTVSSSGCCLVLERVFPIATSFFNHASS